MAEGLAAAGARVIINGVDAARANACLAIGVTYGYGSAAELAHADRLCGSPARIAETISSLRATLD